MRREGVDERMCFKFEKNLFGQPNPMKIGPLKGKGRKRESGRVMRSVTEYVKKVEHKNDI